MADIEKPEYVAFKDALEAVRHEERGGTTYWRAREIQEAIGYTRWENFEVAISKARMACESAGVTPEDQFHQTVKMVDIGSGAVREVPDWFLSRYACYLIAMHSETREAAFAKTYFAIQTRLQEVAQETDEQKRLLLRDKMIVANKDLNEAAKKAGVQKYAVFHDAGYRGLYGLGLGQIKEKKGIAAKEPLLDRIGPTELAANFFRATQAKDKLERDGVSSEQSAINTHEAVGKTIRATIKQLGGVLPENLPAAPSLKKIAAAQKKAQKALDAKGSDDEGQ